MKNLNEKEFRDLTPAELASIETEIEGDKIGVVLWIEQPGIGRRWLIDASSVTDDGLISIASFEDNPKHLYGVIMKDNNIKIQARQTISKNEKSVR